MNRQDSKPKPPPIPDSLRSSKDLFRHAGAPPISGRAGASDSIGNTNTDREISVFVGQLNTESRHASVSHRRESAGWTSSLVLHGLLVMVLCLLIAPADLGDAATLILLRFADEEQEIQLVTMAFSAEPEPNEIPTPAIMEPPTVASPRGATMSGNQRGETSGASEAASGSGPRGSFFGIKATGHDFVYVLDMSGSMRGRRFTRASAELIRSVRGLRDDQMFYVLLFNGSTTQMFGHRRSLPEPVAASEENKQRLAGWLRDAYEGGSTDPRDALRVALRMDPSAVFMLSDGEFDEQKNRKRKTSFVRGNADTFSIVAAATRSTPIHAIAFENPSSCSNMERLAGMTGGEYRFAEYKPTPMTEQALNTVREALAEGDRSSAEILIRELIANRGRTKTSDEVMRTLADMLRNVADQAIKRRDFAAAKDLLGMIIEVDPSGIATNKQQRSLTEDLLDNFASADTDGDGAAPYFKDVVRQYPKSLPAKLVRIRISELAIAKTRKAIARNDRVLAMRTLGELVEGVGAKETFEVSVLRNQLLKEIMGEAKTVRTEKGDVEYAKHLRSISDQYRDKFVTTKVNEQLRQLAAEMLAKRRETGLRGDASDLNRQLKEAFGNHNALVSTRGKSSQDETRARTLLREGMRLERRSEKEAVIRYRNVVSKYPTTIAAQKANERLKDLGIGPSVNEEEKEFLKLFK